MSSCSQQGSPQSPMLLQPRQGRDLFGLADGEGAAGTLLPDVNVWIMIEILMASRKDQGRHDAHGEHYFARSSLGLARSPAGRERIGVNSCSCMCSEYSAGGDA
jgi:hypothetical protein